MVTAVSNY